MPEGFCKENRFFLFNPSVAYGASSPFRGAIYTDYRSPQSPTAPAPLLGEPLAGGVQWLRQPIYIERYDEMNFDL